MGRIVLHIGMHKTGSSSLQHLLSRNRAALRLFGVDYPPARGAEGQRLSKHNDLFLAISHEKDHGRPHPVFGPAADLVARIAERAARFRVTLISAEGLSGESPAFAEALAPLAGPETRVILVLRRQDLWAEAFYRQMVLSREVREARPFEGFLADPATRAHLDYETLTGWWQAAFGPAALRILPHAGPPLLPRILADAGLPGWLARLPGGRARRNPSPHPGLIETLRRLNAAGRETGIAAFRRAGPGPVPGYFTPAARAGFLAGYRAANARLQARLPDACLFPETADPPVWDGRPLPP